MRSWTAAQQRASESDDRAVYLRVQIDRGSGDWVDMTNLEGRDWVKGVDRSASVDRAVVTAVVNLANRVDELSLAPLNDSSKLNASGTIIDIGNPIFIETAVMPAESLPGESDWVEVFRGEIDAIEWERDPIVLRCRDEGGVLDRFIETQVKRPLSVWVDFVEDVMQEILDYELGEGVVTLYSITGDATTPFKPADSPGWLITEYVQRKQPLIQALRALADQIGWQVRYLWNSNTSAFELTLYEPGRELAARGSLFFTGQPTATQTFVLNSTTVTAVASSPSTDEFEIGSTVLETAQNAAAALVAGSESANIANAWANGPSRAAGTLSFTGQPSATETFTVDTTPFTAVAGSPGADEFQIGATLSDTLDNLVAAFNTSMGSTASASKRGSTVVIVWGAAGSAGDSIVFLTSLSNSTADGSGTLGGTVAGYDAVVVVEWGTKGTAGNSITWTTSLSNTTMDGSGTLGGTRLGQAVTSLYTFSPSDYFNVTKLSISRAGIRNVVRVKYGVSDLNRTIVEVQDSASIAKYRRRYMEITEGGSSQIDTEDEARSMAEAVLADLKDPDADQEIELPYFWPAELGDSYTYEANNVHYDSNQQLAVVGIRDQLTVDRARTTIVARGKPSGGFKRWLELDARPGVAPQNDFYQNSAADNLTAASGVGLIVVKYDDPRNMSPPIKDWAFTRVHMSTSGGFTPSTSNLVATGRSTKFEIGGLEPGTTYYVKIVIITESGEEGLVSTQISTATQKVGPYHINEDREYGVLVPNQDFGAQTLPVADYMPDYWNAVRGTPDTEYGLDVVVDTTEHKTGGRSIKFIPTVAGEGVQIITEFYPASGGGLYDADATVKAVGAASDSDSLVVIRLESYASNKTTLLDIDDSFLSIPSIVGTGWVRFLRRGYAPPSNARFMKMLLLVVAQSGDEGDFVVYIDRARCYRGFSEFEASSFNTISSGSWYQTTPIETYDYGGNYTNITGFTAPYDGLYRFETRGDFYAISSGIDYSARFLVNGSTVYQSPYWTTISANDGPFQHQVFLSLSAGDTVVSEIWHNNGSNASVNFLFSGKHEFYEGD